MHRRHKQEVGPHLEMPAVRAGMMILSGAFFDLIYSAVTAGPLFQCHYPW